MPYTNAEISAIINNYRKVRDDYREAHKTNETLYKEGKFDPYDFHARNQMLEEDFYATKENIEFKNMLIEIKHDLPLQKLVTPLLAMIAENPR